MARPQSKFCEKCNHTSLLPFVKNGKVIPNAFIDCECKQPEVEEYTPITSNHIDFPCSYLFRAYHEETLFGRHLPSIDLEPSIESPLHTEKKEGLRPSQPLSTSETRPQLHGGVNL